METEKLINIVEAALFAAGEPLSLERLQGLFVEEEQPSKDALRQALTALEGACEGRGVELREVASGFRFQARAEVATWVSRLWEERPPRYSRALLETLALIAYRQPITRAEIEDIRGVTVSTNIIRTLQEREWVRVVGHRDVPGKPAMYATTRQFLDYFDLRSLNDMPPLAELRDIDKINEELDLREPGAGAAVPVPENDAEPDADRQSQGENDSDGNTAVSAQAESAHADEEVAGHAPEASGEAEAPDEAPTADNVVALRGETDTGAAEDGPEQASGNDDAPAGDDERS